jgi:hypothetical protein
MGTVSVSILLILKRSAHASFELSRTHGRFGHWSSDHCIALVCFQRHGVAASWNPCNSQNAFQWASNRDEALCLYPSSEHLSSLLLQRCRASHPTVQACSLSAHVRHFSRQALKAILVRPRGSRPAYKTPQVQTSTQLQSICVTASS